MNIPDPDPDLCDCPCHTATGTAHAAPCCEPCRICGQRIKTGRYRAHLRAHLVTPALEAEVTELAFAGDGARAVRTYRQATGCTQHEAETAVNVLVIEAAMRPAPVPVLRDGPWRVDSITFGTGEPGQESLLVGLGDIGLGDVDPASFPRSIAPSEPESEETSAMAERPPETGMHAEHPQHAPLHRLPPEHGDPSKAHRCTAHEGMVAHTKGAVATRSYAGGGTGDDDAGGHMSGRSA